MAIGTKHTELLDELIDSVTEHNWGSALLNAIEWKKSVTAILLKAYCECDAVGDLFDRLIVRLRKNTPDWVKEREVLRVIRDISDRLSKYGLAVGRGESDTERAITGLLEIIDGLVAKLAVESPIDKNKFKTVGEIRKYLSTLERVVEEYRDDRMDVMELADLALTAISNFRSMLPGIGKDKAASESYFEFLNTLRKFARATRKDIRAEASLSVFEKTTNFSFTRAKYEVVEEEEIRIPSPPPASEEEFDWVDEEWEKILQHPRIFLITGHKGMGKSCMGYALLEYYAKKYGLKAFLVNTKGRPIPPEKLKLLPDWITVVNDPMEIPSNSVALFDEVYQKYHARTTYSATSTIHDQVVELSRQKNQTLIYVAQQASKIDRNIVGAVDVLCIKKPTLLRVRYERDELHEFSEKAKKYFSKVSKLDNPARYVYIYDLTTDSEYFKTISPPSFWSKELSMFYAGW